MIGSLVSKVQVRPLLLACFIFIALIPVIVISVNVYREAWVSAWREIKEKHQLLAENLASPIGIYLSNHREMLMLLAQRLQTVDLDKEAEVKKTLEQSLKQVAGFNALLLINAEGNLSYCINRAGDEKRKLELTRAPFFKNLSRENVAVSSVMKSPISNKPAIFITAKIGSGGKYLLAASLGIGYIEKLRRQIRFGKKGHSAIVDDKGFVIAHPNPAWMKEMRDLSHLSVIQLMMNGGTGVTEFYSPFIKQDMVAGYTQVPKLGWGVMVPQPKSEVVDQVNRIMYHQIVWGIVSIILAIIAAIFIARAITTPINDLAKSAARILKSNFKQSMPMVKNAPKEIAQLGQVLQQAVSGLIKSRQEYEDLSASLQIRVDKATEDLVSANKRLDSLAKSDHLTNLANRRHFEAFFNNKLGKKDIHQKPFVLLLLDVDKFKNINDKYGHNMGDQVLSKIAEILQSKVREHDLVARYGGDEFVALMNAQKNVAMQRAEEISKEIELCEFKHDCGVFRITASIGLLYMDHKEQNIDKSELFKSELFKKVDAAMYAAKRQGRNTIVEVSA